MRAPGSNKAPFLTSPHSPGLFWKGAPSSRFGKQPTPMIPQGPGHLPWSLLHFLGVQLLKIQLLEERFEVVLGEK